MTKQYGALDLFRPIAAILVIAIHCPPLEDISSGWSYFSVNILARLAVPFFFMVTGRFLNFAAPWKYIKKMALIYLGAVVLYLPLGIIGGDFGGANPLTVLKMLVFDGTYYHLWYFPALIIGVLIMHLLSKRLKITQILAICGVLYFIGLLGDSWYGFVKGVPVLSNIYDGIFAVSSYTRNGIFMAPMFLALGMLAGKKKFSNDRFFLICFAVSFLLMTLEAELLKNYGSPKHESMYLLLPLCIFCLFRLLMIPDAPLRPALRGISATVYILHPLVIGVVRRIPISFISQSSLPRFIISAVLSFGAAVCLHWAWGLVKSKLKAKRQTNNG